MAGSPLSESVVRPHCRSAFLGTGEPLLCEVCTRDHRSELGGSYISREVIESAIGVHPQVVRIDKGGHTLDRLGDSLGSLDRVGLDIDSANPYCLVPWEVMQCREVLHS